MAGRDRRLHLVRPGLPAPQRAGEQRGCLGDLRTVPPRAVLRFEEHQIAGTVDPGGPARVLQEKQRQQPLRFGLVGHEPDEGASEVNRFAAQPRPYQVGAGSRGVPLIEEQVQHREHARRALGEQVGRRHPIRDTRLLDFAFRAYQPLGHRGLGHQERAGDLAGREPGERPQRERHARLDRQRRVTAGEDQAQLVVVDAAVVVGVGRQRAHPSLLDLRCPHRGSPHPVDGSVAGGGGQPRAGIARDAVDGPAFQRPFHGVLRAFLGEVPVARHADQGCDDPSPFVPEGGGDSSRYISQIGLTSIDPSPAAGIFAATSIASSRFPQSTR